MGGKEGSRGYLYQAFVSVLEALRDDDWDRIYIELDTKDDKVDIALEREEKIFKAIQVKSTINTFAKNSVKLWLKDLIEDDVDASHYELVLIGQCTGPTMDFINSIEKFQKNDIDNKSKKSLENFDTSILNDRKVKIKCLPFSVDDLEKIVIASMFEYSTYMGKVMNYEQIRFLSSATIMDHLIYSTTGDGMPKEEFKKEMEDRISFFAYDYNIQRKSIGIKSFLRGSENLEKQTESCLLLVDKFEGRFLKECYDWNEDVYDELNNFLIENTNNEEAYQIFLDTHSSIAFSAGRILDTKSGIDVFPMQKTANGGIKLWDARMPQKTSLSTWHIDCENISDTFNDTALIINATRNIYEDVKMYIKSSNIPIGRIINLSFYKADANIYSIADGNHAATLANSVFSATKYRTPEERLSTLHIFSAAPNAFMFFLGQNSRGMGKCIIYDFDNEQKKTASYIPTIKFM